MKSTAIQALILVGAAVVVALTYNALSSHSLPLVREETKVVSDAELFSDAQPTSENGQGSDRTVVTAPRTDTAVQAPAVVDNTTKTDVTKKGVEAPPTGTGSVGTEMKTAEEKPEKVEMATTVTYEQMVKLVAKPEVMFIDARNAEEYEQGHIRDAKNIFAPDFQKHIPEIIGLPRDKRIIVYCGGGACELSHEVAANMKNFGFQHVYVYAGGWNEWTRKQEKK